jgi:uncharacterized protein (TIGR02266 family)
MESRTFRFERTQKDRRRTLRCPMIVLQVKLEDGRRTFFGYAKNLSRGGLFIASVSPQEPGNRYQVEFCIPDMPNTQVRCACEVVWKRPFSRQTKAEPGMGLRFIDLPPEQALAIDQWAQAGP